MYDERQQLTHYIGVQTDISAQILAQERLSARDKLLHKLSEQAPGLICQMHMDGKRLSLPYASEARFVKYLASARKTCAKTPAAMPGAAPGRPPASVSRPASGGAPASAMAR